MGLYYLDSSALVKLYVREPGSERMVRLASRAEGHTLGVSSIARAECRAALRRRQRAGDLSAEAAEELLLRLTRQMEALYLVQPVTEAVIDAACALVDRYPLRAYDAMQLAGCLTLRSAAPQPPCLVCSDLQLRDAAEQEGLAVWDPAE